jgi:hypothetical protein
MDMYAQDSIELLQKSGIQFKKHEEDGIDPHLFAELLTTSGVVFMENVTWLSFHAYVLIFSFNKSFIFFLYIVVMILVIY